MPERLTHTQWFMLNSGFPLGVWNLGACQEEDACEQPPVTTSEESSVSRVTPRGAPGLVWVPPCLRRPHGSLCCFLHS